MGEGEGRVRPLMDSTRRLQPGTFFRFQACKGEKDKQLYPCTEPLNITSRAQFSHVRQSEIWIRDLPI